MTILFVAWCLVKPNFLFVDDVTKLELAPYLLYFFRSDRRYFIAMSSYVPKSGNEIYVYENLWKVASPNGTDLSGLEAVTFFRKSEVDSGILKSIWGLSTPSATLNKSQFFVALRYITLVQNGDIPISKGISFLQSCFYESLKLLYRKTCKHRQYKLRRGK